MVRIVQAALSHVQNKVTPSKRGAIISGLGKRDYDIIPAFMYKDEKQNEFHIIPGEGGWEVNPTSLDTQHLQNLCKTFPQHFARKLLGYRDFVRLVKWMTATNGWEESHGLSSFIIRKAVAIALEQAQPTYNQHVINRIFKVLNRFITCGFQDPYTKKSRRLKGKTPFNRKLILNNLSTIGSA